jgi:hypothetical protein
MTKRTIPTVPRAADAETQRFLAPLKENLEIISGQRGGLVEKLPSTATTAQIIEKINAILDRLQ